MLCLRGFELYSRWVPLISDTDNRTLLYCSIARPKLEYGSELWSPYTCAFARKCPAHSYGVCLTIACSRLRDGGGKSFSKKKAKNAPPPPFPSRARLIFAALIIDH